MRYDVNVTRDNAVQTLNVALRAPSLASLLHMAAAQRCTRCRAWDVQCVQIKYSEGACARSTCVSLMMKTEELICALAVRALTADAGERQIDADRCGPQSILTSSCRLQSDRRLCRAGLLLL